MHSKSTLTKSFILLIILNLFSCISLKDVQLIQPDENLKLDANGKILYQKPEYYIQKDDEILIKVSSASGESMGILRDFISSGNAISGAGVQVRKDGSIELPRIGKIHLEGLTIEQARKKVQEEFYKIYEEKGTFIDVNLASIEYTIVGEAGQGIFTAPKRTITLLDAFAQSAANNTANNVYADLKHVRVIRTDAEGTKQVYVDLTKETVMNSEYYWVQNNDIIVVNARKQKVWGIGLNPLSIVTTVTGAITAVFAAIFIFRGRF